MQLMPNTAAGLSVKISLIRREYFGGCKYLRQMLDRYNGNLALALPLITPDREMSINEEESPLKKHGNMSEKS